jgi:acetyl esterase/lipase
MRPVTRALVATAVLLSLAAAGCSADVRPGPRLTASGQRSGPAATPLADAPLALASADARIPAGTCEAGACTSIRLAQWRSVPFTPPVRCGARGATCRLSMDILAPAAGGPHPLVIVLAGGPQPTRGQAYADAAGLPLAARGMVVMRASWRQGSQYGGGWPASLRDVACAIGVARRVGPDYGARPDHVTLVGHSLGGWVAAVVGLTTKPFAPARAQCHRTAGSTSPDAVVTLAGAVDEVRHQGLGSAYLNAFFGGTQRERPKAWAAGDPFALAEHRAGRTAVPFTLVRGGRDDVITRSAAPALQRLLRRSGYRSRLVEAPMADHNGVLVAPRAVKAVLAAASSGP